MKRNYDKRSEIIFEHSLAQKFVKLPFVVASGLNVPESGVFQYETRYDEKHIFIRISIENNNIWVDLDNIGEAFSWQNSDNNIEWSIKQLDKLLDALLHGLVEVHTIGIPWFSRSTIIIQNLGCYKYWRIFSSVVSGKKKLRPWLDRVGRSQSQ